MESHEPQYIYVLQVFVRYKRDEDHPTREERTIGWYSTLESAVENLHANAAVFAEEHSIDGSERIPFYPYALIEKVPEGPYACGTLGDIDCGDVLFYKWDNGDYTEMPQPKELNGTIGFTMG